MPLACGLSFVDACSESTPVTMGRKLFVIFVWVHEALSPMKSQENPSRLNFPESYNFKFLRRRAATSAIILIFSGSLRRYSQQYCTLTGKKVTESERKLKQGKFHFLSSREIPGSAVFFLFHSSTPVPDEGSALSVKHNRTLGIPIEIQGLHHELVSSFWKS